MKYILTDTFDKLLSRNGSYNEYYKGVQKLAEVVLVDGKKVMFISELLDLYKVKKYVRVDVIVKKCYHILHDFTIKVESAAELTLDEYIDLAMSKEPGGEEAFYELLSMID